MSERSRRLVSVVVPTLDEEENVGPCLASIRSTREDEPFEAIVSDGGSRDGTIEAATRHHAIVVEGAAGRALQMNAGAAKAAGDILIFLHADTRLPAGALQAVRDVLRDPDVVGGCFRLRFDHDHPLLRVYGAATRLPLRWFRFGDQAFFVRRSVYEKLGGYRPLPICEDVDFFDRMSQRGRVVVLPQTVCTSARRYLRDGVARQQLKNVGLVALYRLGVRPSRLARHYAPARR